MPAMHKAPTWDVRRDGAGLAPRLPARRVGVAFTVRPKAEQERRAGVVLEARVLGTVPVGDPALAWAPRFAMNPDDVGLLLSFCRLNTPTLLLTMHSASTGTPLTAAHTAAGFLAEDWYGDLFARQSDMVPAGP